jgi:multidrug efflux system membrane fusion protein
MEITTNKILANKISPSILLLSDEGILGVRKVNAANVVEFLPISIIEDTEEGIWVSGIPNSTNLIVRGQGFVENGQTVEVTQL